MIRIVLYPIIFIGYLSIVLLVIIVVYAIIRSIWHMIAHPEEYTQAQNRDKYNPFY